MAISGRVLFDPVWVLARDAERHADDGGRHIARGLENGQRAHSDCRAEFPPPPLPRRDFALRRFIALALSESLAGGVLGRVAERPARVAGVIAREYVSGLSGRLAT